MDIESSDDEMEIEGRRTRKMMRRTQSKLREMSRARSAGSIPKSRDQNKVISLLILVNIARNLTK